MKTFEKTLVISRAVNTVFWQTLINFNIQNVYVSMHPTNISCGDNVTNPIMMRKNSYLGIYVEL